MGFPAELVQGASRIDEARAQVLVAGPVDCTFSGDAGEEGDDEQDAETALANHSAGVIDGGVDSVTPVQIWDQVMKHYKVAQLCRGELERLKKLDKPNEAAPMRADEAKAVAAAVEE